MTPWRSDDWENGCVRMEGGLRKQFRGRIWWFYFHPGSSRIWGNKTTLHSITQLKWQNRCNGCQDLRQAQETVGGKGFVVMAALTFLVDMRDQKVGIQGRCYPTLDNTPERSGRHNRCRMGRRQNRCQDNQRAIERTWGKCFIVALVAVRAPINMREQNVPLSDDSSEMGWQTEQVLRQVTGWENILEKEFGSTLAGVWLQNMGN